MQVRTRDAERIYALLERCMDDREPLPVRCPEKRNMAYRYSFRLLDVESGLYVAYGYSSRSEKDTYRKAMAMAKELCIEMKSIRLDKYYSTRATLMGLGNAAPSCCLSAAREE